MQPLVLGRGLLRSTSPGVSMKGLRDWRELYLDSVHSILKGLDF